MKRPYRRNITRLRRTQGCLTDCVAYVLNMHPERVPFFVYPRLGWMARLRRFFKTHGYLVRWVECSEPPLKGIHIICGPSLKWKTAGHVVVYRNGKMVYDPDYPSKWSNKRITHQLLVTRLPWR